jgi:hypothetical protein
MPPFELSALAASLSAKPSDFKYNPQEMLLGNFQEAIFFGF